MSDTLLKHCPKHYGKQHIAETSLLLFLCIYIRVKVLISFTIVLCAFAYKWWFVSWLILLLFSCSYVRVKLFCVFKPILFVYLRLGLFVFVCATWRKVFWRVLPCVLCVLTSEFIFGVCVTLIWCVFTSALGFSCALAWVSCRPNYLFVPVSKLTTVSLVFSCVLPWFYL